MVKRATLGELEQLLLLSILHLDGNAYAKRIREHLDESVGRLVSLGTIYVCLTRLENKGWARSWLADPTPVRGGRAKRFYEVTAPGHEALQRSKDALSSLWQDIEIGAGGKP